MGGVITIDWYDVAGSGDDIIRMPNFAFKGKEYGGLHGACSCGNTGLGSLWNLGMWLLIRLLSGLKVMVRHMWGSLGFARAWYVHF
jgi:hypothetical protein